MISIKCVVYFVCIMKLQEKLIKFSFLSLDYFKNEFICKQKYLCAKYLITFYMPYPKYK